MDTAYSSLEASLHDQFWAAEGEPAELPLLAEFLTTFAGPAIEVGCGSGRLLLPLLAAGHQLEGLDPSLEMLSLCRESASALDLSPVLHLGEMAGFRPPGSYQAVAVPAFTLQLAPDPAAVLCHLASWLDPGGGIFLTTFRPEAELAGALPEDQWFEDHRITLGDGSSATLETRHALDHSRRLLDRQHRYRVLDREGAETGRHQSRQRLRWFDDGELESMVSQAGLQVTRRIADFDPDAPLSDAQILTLFAQSTPDR